MINVLMCTLIYLPVQFFKHIISLKIVKKISRPKCMYIHILSKGKEKMAGEIRNIVDTGRIKHLSCTFGDD